MPQNRQRDDDARPDSANIARMPRPTLLALAAGGALAAIVLSGCKKPDIPAAWKDIVPEEGMMAPTSGDPWVRERTGEPNVAGGDAKNHALVLDHDGMVDGRDNAPYTRGKGATIDYATNKIKPDELRVAFEKKITGAGYKLLMKCENSNAVVGWKAGNDVVSVSIDSVTETLIWAKLWRVNADAINLPQGAKCDWTKDAFADDEAKSACEWGNGKRICILKR